MSEALPMSAGRLRRRRHVQRSGDVRGCRRAVAAQTPPQRDPRSPRTLFMDPTRECRRGDSLIGSGFVGVQFASWKGRLGRCRCPTQSLIGMYISEKDPLGNENLPRCYAGDRGHQCRVGSFLLLPCRSHIRGVNNVLEIVMRTNVA